MNINDIIISEIKKDRVKLLNALSDFHLRDMMDDVNVPIELSNDWNSVSMRSKS